MFISSQINERPNYLKTKAKWAQIEVQKGFKGKNFIFFLPRDKFSVSKKNEIRKIAN